ncbi:MAG: TIGR04282 family arsenosugar biosynthesis glycosyltransferase [Actinomycetota bacterium]|nr:TIGR04282 family arsenosugar biosynthesis glycosyltransferase [Actinomycetota bacterium]
MSRSAVDLPASEPPAIALLVIAKAPVPGLAKTRLAPAFGADGAARLAAAALGDTLTAVLRTPAARRFVVLAGAAPTVGTSWLPAGIEVVPQRGSGFDERLAAAFDDVHASTGLPVLLIGMDTPQVSDRLLTAAVDTLLLPGTDAVLGTAADGGWWALGLRRPDRSLLLGVPMSTSRTGRAQRTRLMGAGLSVRDLPTLRDVDTPADAVEVAALVPGSAFGLELARLGELDEMRDELAADGRVAS